MIFTLNPKSDINLIDSIKLNKANSYDPNHAKSEHL